MNSKQWAFIAMMSALGLLLSAISLNVAPLLGTVGQNGAALDLSHVATFIAAIFAGPYVGAIVGFLSGIYAGYYFGFVMGTIGMLSVIGLPLGKALTGFTAGFLYKRFNVHKSSRPSTFTVPVILASYIPECIYTILYFLYIVPYFYGGIWDFMILMVIPKAWIEITIMSFLMGALVENSGFKDFILKFFYAQSLEKIRAKKES